jgi:hypothetical protein
MDIRKTSTLLLCNGRLLMAAAISAQHNEAVVFPRDEITKTTKQRCYGRQKSREYAFRG